MPEELKKDVSDAAAISGRSLHAELLFRLSASLEKNHSDSEFLGARLRQKEAELERTKALHEVVHLSNCVMFLLHVVERSNARMTKDEREVAGLAEKAAREGLALEKRLNPELLLEEYRKEIEQAKDMLKVWAPGYFPWPGGPDEDLPPVKQPKRTVKPKPKP